MVPAVNRARAEGLAEQLLAAEGLKPADGDEWLAQVPRVTGSLASVFPTIEPGYEAVMAVVTVEDTQAVDGSEKTRLFGLREGTLWSAELNRSADGELGVLVGRYAPGSWGVFGAADNFEMDSGARVVHRKWSVAMGPDIFGIETAQRENSAVGAPERFCRVLAQMSGWTVDDFVWPG